jgi:hypothetical protein
MMTGTSINGPMTAAGLPFRCKYPHDLEPDGMRQSLH